MRLRVICRDRKFTLTTRLLCSQAIHIHISCVTYPLYWVQHATELVDMWSLKNGQEINRTKGTRVDYIQVRRRGPEVERKQNIQLINIHVI